MFRSIRRRLIATYTLLTVFAIAAVSVLALTLFQRQLARQEQAYLRANAEAIAAQAAGLLIPVAQPLALQQLASTAALLGNVQVRITDAGGALLADSGLPDAAEEFALIVGGLPADFAAYPPLLFFSLPDEHPERRHWPHGRRGGSQRTDQGSGLTPAAPELLPEDMIVIRRAPSMWGALLAFTEESQIEPALPLLTAPLAQPAESAPAQAAPVASVRELAGAAPPAARSGKVVTLPIGPADTPLGAVELSNGADLGAASLAAIRNALAIAAAVAALLTVAVSLVVSRSLIAPLAHLSQAAQRMAAGDLAARAPLTGRDEFGDLARRFNTMADRLQSAFSALEVERDTLRRFIADASHELRTPITALRTFGELLQGPASADPAAQSEFLVASAEQVARLEWITANLLDLSRLDAGLVQMELAEHDAATLLESAAAPFLPAAQRQDVALLLSPTFGLAVQGDRPRLEMALGNLLDNALKFTPAGGAVRLGADHTDGGVRLWVEDTGSGIPAEDLPHIFERFRRGRQSVAPGSGLGLAIVEAIAKAHGGHITATSTPGQGARFDLFLPQT